MSIAESPRMTTEQLLAMPDDGMARELIAGELKESPMTVRNRFHTYVVTRIAYLLEAWRSTQTKPAGEVHTGEVGTILKRNPDTTVEIDVAWFSQDVMNQQTDETTLIVGVPRLAVEVLSPSDRQDDIFAKMQVYLAAGVELVRLVDPYFRTVQVHRSGAEPETLNRQQHVSEIDLLPGLDIAVAEIFPQSSS